MSSCAKTLQGRDLLLCQVTDHRVSDVDKQIVLITCTHAGRELNSTTSALHLVKWLIGDSKLARTCRRKQLVTDGAFTADGQFIRLPQIDDEPLLRLWQQRVFGLLLDEGKIEPKQSRADARLASQRLRRGPQRAPGGR